MRFDRLQRAPTDALPSNHRRALHEACDVVLDALFDDAREADSKHWDANESYLGNLLPRRYLIKYQAGFVRRFTVTLATVAWKLEQRAFIPFACVAEELAAWVLVQAAEGILEEESMTADFESLVSRAFEDTDFLTLYEDDMDGIDDSELATVMGMTSLRFEDWFEPFDRASELGSVHPFAAGESDSSLQEQNSDMQDDEDA